MLIDKDLRATIQDSDRLVAEAEATSQTVQVYCDSDGKYHVLSNGFARHSGPAEDVMRALAFYLQSALYRKPASGPTA